MTEFVAVPARKGIDTTSLAVGSVPAIVVRAMVRALEPTVAVKAPFVMAVESAVRLSV